MPALPFSSPDCATRVGVVALTVVVFAAVVAFVTVRLRQGLQQQVLHGHADMLAAVASMQLRNEAEVVGVNNAPGALLIAASKAQKFRDVVLVNVFDANRNFGGALPFPATDDPPPPPPGEWAELMAGRVITRLYTRETGMPPANLVSASSSNSTAPLIEAWVPMRAGDDAPVLGAAQFWSDGRFVEGQYKSID